MSEIPACQELSPRLPACYIYLSAGKHQRLVFSQTPYLLVTWPQTTNEPQLKTITRDFTATTFVVDAGATLLLLHKKLGAWLPPGGHIGPNELPEDAAVREVREETGLEVELLGSSRQMGSVAILIQPI